MGHVVKQQSGGAMVALLLLTPWSAKTHCMVAFWTTESTSSTKEARHCRDTSFGTSMMTAVGASHALPRVRETLSTLFIFRCIRRRSYQYRLWSRSSWTLNRRCVRSLLH